MKFFKYANRALMAVMTDTLMTVILQYSKRRGFVLNYAPFNETCGQYSAHSKHLHQMEVEWSASFPGKELGGPQG